MNKIIYSLPLAMLLSLCAFGQLGIDKQIQMNGGTNAEKQITGVGNPTSADHAVNAGNVQSGVLVYAIGALSGSTYTVTLSPVPAAYTAGMVINFKPDLASTSPVSINVNSLGARLIKKNVSADLGIGDIAAGQLVSVIYDGANFQLLAGGNSDNTYIQNQTTADQNAGFRISGNGIFNGGSVAIGKPTPTSNLDIKGTVNVAGTSAPAMFSATGGTVTTNGGFTIHTFTSSGTFTPNAAGTIEVLVVAGGGGGSSDLAGGGGGGGVVYQVSYPVTAQAYTVTVGAGGYGGGTSRYSNTLATNGQNSSFGSITAVGGGRGGAYWNSNGVNDVGAAGGSGGGGGARDAVGSVGSGGGAATPGQGNSGGRGGYAPNFPGGGGGGAGTVGASADGALNGGNGGNGLSVSISGSAVTYGGGGGGGGYTVVSGVPGNGGTGGGGKGAGFGSLTAVAGTPNTGGGGGGGGYATSTPLAGAAGGSGIIIIRYTTGATASSGIVVDATGKMGVGTTSPTAQLHTTGSVRFASYTGGFLTVDGNGNLGVSGGSGGAGAGSLFGASGTPTTFVATGGTVTQVNGYNIHTFTSSGTFTANGAANVEVLVVGGGGGGSGDLAGGGGGGGVVYNASLPVSAQTYNVTVGAGGNAGGTVRQSNTLATSGGSSSFSTITAIGGGRGGAYWNSNGTNDVGAAGGSGGGGAARDNVGSVGSGGGAATAGQGNPGGRAGYNPNYPGAGGGGAGSAGVASDGGINGGNGGDGLTYSISGSPVTYGGGGGGGGYTVVGGLPGNGGTGGGGKGAGSGSLTSVAGTPNTGGGGGGGGYAASAPLAGAAGGSGIVIIRYPISTVITSGIFVGTNGNVGIGTTSPTQTLQVVGNICATGTIASCSDSRYKKDITPLTNALAGVIEMRGVNYYWKKDEYPEKKFGDEKQIGFIAQELEKIYPELVTTDSEGYKTIDYSRLTPILVEAIKEQQQEIEQLKKQVEQKATIGEVNSLSTQLKAQIDELKTLMEMNGIGSQK